MSNTTAPATAAHAPEQEQGESTRTRTRTMTTETTPLLQAGNATAGVTLAAATTVEPPRWWDGGDETENPDRPKGFRFAVVYSCILLGDFFVGYDTSCVTTLAPVISDEFRAIGDIGWYGIAYILALASTILAFGQLYSLLPVKPIFLSSLAVFTAGSVICATAPSSLVFILGRAVAGLGGAGIFSGASIVLANVVPLHNRPTYQGISSAVECISIAFGPTISGAIAHYSSWRVSFLVIAPAAMVNILAVWSLVPSLPPLRPAQAAGPSSSPSSTTTTTAKAEPETEPWHKHLDILGMTLFIPTAICLVLALQQWASHAAAAAAAPREDDKRPITLLASTTTTTTIILLLAFAASQIQKGDRAMLPPALIRRRCVALGSAASFFTAASLYVFGFFLPVYFQAIRGADTLASGIMYLPSAASLAVGVTAGRRVADRCWLGGYYTPLMVLGTVLMSVGAGMMGTAGLGGDAPPLELWVVYQVVYGLGAGVAFQQPYTAVQTVLEEEEEEEECVLLLLPTAMVVLSTVQEIGGVVALAVAQSVFVGRLAMRLEGVGMGLDAREVLGRGTLSLIGSVPEEMRGLVYVAYMRTLREVFWIGLVCACLTVCAVGIEWRSVRHGKREGGSRSV